jgi:leader peptidase (prepilin peptidase)/N-methyltransferase
VAPALWLFFSALILGTFVDFDHFIIPDRVSIGGMIAGPLVSMLVPALHGTDSAMVALLRSLAGLALGFGLLWLTGFIGRLAFRKEAMGFGDVKLLGAIGAFTGWQGVLFTLFLSSLTGSLVGVTLVILGLKRMQSRIPFGPYLALGAVLWSLAGTNIWNFYTTVLTAHAIR